MATADDHKAEMETKEQPDEAEDGRTLNLVSQEGEMFAVPIAVAKMSELVKTMIDGGEVSTCARSC
jgi:hypothetical protein